MDFDAVSLRQLRYLDAVATGRSFSEAADELSVSQSALSQGLARLEELSGTTLFEPDGRRRRLTPQGRTLADYAKTVLVGISRTSERLRSQSEGRDGTLRVAMIDAAALYLFPDRVERFRQAHPGVDLKITVAASQGCLDLVRSFEADLAIVVGPATGFTTVPLVGEPFYLYGFGIDPKPADSWLLYPTGSHTRAMIDRSLYDLSISPTVVGESGNPDVLRQLARLMGGWTVLPDVVGAHDAPGWRRGRQIGERPIVAAHRRRGLDPLPARLVTSLR
ncbi:MAG: LysR family transcriptional regulator [Acidimicrobiia bacterium]|nr:LysR family transcriptional regulator [Acidimicrobiia bacterium]